jgi:hypothetical protein
MYSTIPIHWNIKSALASPGRSRVGPALYVFRLLGYNPRAPLSCPDIFLYKITPPAVSRDAAPTHSYTTLELASRALLSSKKPATNEVSRSAVYCTLSRAYKGRQNEWITSATLFSLKQQCRTQRFSVSDDCGCCFNTHTTVISLGVILKLR